MKVIALKVLIALTAGAFVTPAALAVSALSSDDFQTGTLEGWSATTGTVTVVGAGQFAIQAVARRGRNLDVTNAGAEWTGNYTAAGITGILADVRNVNGATAAFPVNLTLRMRLAMNGPGGAFATAATLVPPGGGWVSGVLFDLDTLVPITDAAPAGGSIGFDLGATLAAVSEIRFLHNTDPAWRGLTTPGANKRGFRLDNIAVVVDNAAIAIPTPIPATLPLLVSALAGIAFAALRRRSDRPEPTGQSEIGT